MDYRYEVPSGGRDFHRQRKAFIIIDGVLDFLPFGSTMLHYEYCQSKGISKEVYNKITRGYYINGNVVFYKGNFIYDENVIKEALQYLDEISKKIEETEFEINFGLRLDENFAFDFHYGKYSNGKIIKSEE